MTNFLNYFEKTYGEDEEIPHYCGWKHTYLVTDLDFSDPRYVKVSMESYVKEIIEDFPEKITGMTKTCAVNHLFRVEANGKNLDKRHVELFHRYVGKVLFISKCG